MARKPTVTLNDVRKAIEELESAKQKVSIRAVMKITGGMTSLVTEMIDIVMHNRAAATRALSALTPDLLVAINQEVDLHVTRNTTSLSNELLEIRQHQDELREIIRDFESQHAADEAGMEALGQQLAATTKQADEDRRVAEAAIAARDTQLTEKDREIAALRQELNSVRTEMAGLQHLSSTVAELKDELKKTRDELRKAEGRAADAEGRLDELRKQRKKTGTDGAAGEKAPPKKPKSSD